MVRPKFYIDFTSTLKTTQLINLKWPGTRQTTSKKRLSTINHIYAGTAAMTSSLECIQVTVVSTRKLTMTLFTIGFQTINLCLDVYEALPHVSAYEQNLDGFNEEHLQRIEKYWQNINFLVQTAQSKQPN